MSDPAIEFSATFAPGTAPVPQPQSSPLTILITGASRGLGLELVKQYSAAYETNTIIAAVRDPASKSSSEVLAFASAHPNVHVIPMDVSSEASIKASVSHLPASVKHVDLLYNNAGIMGPLTDLEGLTSASVLEVLNVNVVAPLIINATYLPLLRASPNPKVIVVGSAMGSSVLTEAIVGMKSIPYSLSKSGAAYVSNALHFAIPDVTFLAIQPGWVETEMGSLGGTVKPPVQQKESIQAIIAAIQNKNRAQSGQFFSTVTGNILPY